MKNGSYRELIAWQRAMDLAEMAYAFGRGLRIVKHSALANQLERAAASIPANIAEGHGRYRAAEFENFLLIALGSLREVETFVQLAGRIGVLTDESVRSFLRQADDLGRVLYGLRKMVQKRRSESRFPPLSPDS